MLAEAIQLEAVLRSGLNIGQDGEQGFLPGILVVVLVKALDISIAFWVSKRRENQLGADIQTQAEHLAEHTGVGKAAAKAAFVVNLSVLRQSQLFPNPDQKVGCIGRALSQTLLSGWIVRNDIQGIEASDTGSTRQEVRHDIDLDQLQRHLWIEMWVMVFRLPWRQVRFGQTSLGNDPLDAGNTRLDCPTALA